MPTGKAIETMDKKAVLAIDIGGSLTKIGLVFKDGSILNKRVFKTPADESFRKFMLKLRTEVDILISELPPEIQIISIGVGAPNANPYSGLIENPPNLKWGSTIPLARDVAEAFGKPVTIANDANAAALGEMLFGSARGMKDFVTLTLGTGLGSGIIISGKLLIGAHGAAGEIGHVNVDPNGRNCNCGLRGCLETYAPVTGIKRTVFELLAEMREDSPLRNLNFAEMTGIHISDAALEGDAIALMAFKKTGEILGSKMADTAAHVDPEAFILSGGLSKAGEILLNPVSTSMEEHLFNTYKGKIKVILSQTTGSDAILGPAALAWLELDTKN
jgi:glucokinase